jgi:hypothetical protein
MEKYFAVVDKNWICDIYKEALSHYGKSDVGLWLNFIEFLYLNYQSDTKITADAYWKAKKELSEEYVEVFEQKFNLFKIKFDNKSLKTDDIDEIECD